jgi:hypothetical protein
MKLSKEQYQDLFEEKIQDYEFDYNIAKMKFEDGTIKKIISLERQILHMYLDAGFTRKEAIQLILG